MAINAASRSAFRVFVCVCLFGVLGALTVLPFRLLTLQCSTTVLPRWVLTLRVAALVAASTKYGSASCVVDSDMSSVSSLDGGSVKGDENSCQKFRGNESNGSPSRGLTTADGEREMFEALVCLLVIRYSV